MNTTPLAHFETECIEPYEAMICIIIATIKTVFTSLSFLNHLLVGPEWQIMIQ